MLTYRAALTLAAAMTTLTLGITACSSSSSGPGPSGPSGPSGSSGSEGGLKQCGASGDTSRCTQAEEDSYTSCIQSTCSSTIDECYGSGFQSGNYGGACGDYVNCFNACDCGDTECFTKCPEPTESCTTCLERLTECADRCTVPDCMKTTPGDSATCADLATCCADKTDEEEKQTCLDALELASGNDPACDGVYQSVCK